MTPNTMKSGVPRRAAVVVFCAALLLALCQLSHADEDIATLLELLLGTGNGDTIGLDVNQDGVIDVSDIVRDAKSLPNVEFELATLTVSEGQVGLQCNVTADADFSGIVQFEISGSADAGSDYAPLTGNMQLTDSAGVIALTFLEDWLIEPTESLALSIKEPSGSAGAYAVGARSRLMVLIEDNDATWEGELLRGDLVSPFEVALLQHGDQLQATIQSDGTGFVPAGTWPVALQVTAGQLSGTMGPVDMPASSSFLGESHAAVIQLSADPTTHPSDLVDLSSLIQGSFSQELTFPGLNSAHHNRVGATAIHGRFTLTRYSHQIPELQAALTAAPTAP